MKRCDYCRRRAPSWWLVGGFDKALPNGLRRCLLCTVIRRTRRKA